MNKFSRNINLLKDDLLNSFRSIKIKKDNKDIFKKENEKEVLYLYRHMLKTIPKMQNSLFEEKYAYEVNYFFYIILHH
jgi:hypothetical protein